MRDHHRQADRARGEDRLLGQSPDLGAVDAHAFRDGIDAAPWGGSRGRRRIRFGDDDEVNSRGVNIHGSNLRFRRS